ncbi:MAG: hypothetical protein ACRCYC_10355 [Paraclostridium sp.]|uniref:hypothetical protein n=1 Tax=Paraclostridium sp. TaxID=2023273 RepID=UPI003F3C5144
MNSKQQIFNSCITGNTEIFNTENYCDDLKIDISTTTHNGVNIWGQVKNKNDECIPFAFVKLVKPHLLNGIISFEEIAHCVSDSSGFYQFNILAKPNESYQLLVSKNTSL